MSSRLIATAALLLLFYRGNVATSNRLVNRETASLMFGPPVIVPTTTTTSSFNWWPYSLVEATPSSMTTTTNTIDNLDVVTPTPTGATSTSITSTAAASYIEISALPPDATAKPRRHTSVKRPFKAIYLAPVFSIGGSIFGSLCTWVCFRCRSRSHSGISDTLEPGPPYVPSEKDLDDEEQGSPSKYSRHGSPCSVSRALLTRNSTYRIPPPSTPFKWPPVTPRRCDDYDPFVTPTATTARTTRMTDEFMSPDPLSLLDEDDGYEVIIAPYDSPNHKSIQTGILDKLKKGSSRKKAEVRSRNGHSRLDSDCQVVDGEGWGFGWMRGKKDGVDTYTAVPARMASTKARNAEASQSGMRRIDSAILPTSPNILSSARIESDYFFSPAAFAPKTPEKNKRGKSLRKEKTLPAPPPASASLPSIRPSASYYQGASPPKRSAAERYLDRHSALNKVEEIVARSRKESGISIPQSPTLFGAVPVVGEGERLVLEHLEGVGIEQRLFG
jgi:hypothetical protein